MLVIKRYRNSIYIMDITDINIILFYRHYVEVDDKAKSISIATHVNMRDLIRFQYLLELTFRWD